MKQLLKIAPYLAVALGLYLLGSWIYDSGSRSGASAVQQQWDAEKEEILRKKDELIAKYDEKEKAHREENQRINHELAEAKRKYEVDLADQLREYSERVRSSEARADIYQRQARSGSIESSRLASHAARLDSALEEGRQLVRELRQTVGLRDRQIKLLSAQIKADRALLNEEGINNGNGSD